MDMTYLIRFFLRNRVNRYVFSLLSGKDEQATSILEDMFFLYVGRNDGLTFLRRIELFPFYLFFEMGRILFGQSRKDVRRELSNPTFRKGISLTMRSVAHYGLTYPQQFVAPPVVVWNFTNICNLKCKHCYQSAGKKLPDELSLKERLDVIDQLSREDVFLVAFSGGEPLMDKDLWKVIERAKENYMYVSVATNGTLISPEVARKLSDVGVDYVEISLDSVNPRKHDEFRGVPGAWDKTITGIKNAVAERTYQVGLAPTITRMNFDELEDMIKLSTRLKVDKFFVFNFIPVGEGKNLIDLDLTPKMREEMLNILYDYYVKYGIVTLTTCPQYARVAMQRSKNQIAPSSHYSVDKGSRARLLAEFIGGCGVGRGYCAIQPNGVVTPCVYLPIVVGDLKKQSFRQIWNTSPVLKELRRRDDLKGPCGVCEYRSACGGCRARAYAYFGDYKAPDPGCINNEDAFLRLKEGAVAVANADREE